MTQTYVSNARLARALWAAFFVLATQVAFAQTTKIRGVVKDAQTGETLPFVNLSFTDRAQGEITDLNGEFFLETSAPGDSLLFMFMGYDPHVVAVRKGEYQELEVLMRVSEVALEEVVVYAGENPAHAMLKNIQRNRARNDPSRWPCYSYDSYNKLQFDLADLGPAMTESRLLRPIDFVFENIDTSAVNGKAYLPIFISETLSRYHFQRFPKRVKEEIHASRLSGIDDPQIAEFTGKMYLEANVYDGFISVFGKSFVSPISALGLTYYEYYLVDSAFRDSHWSYRMTFKPRRAQEPTFTGEMWVHDSTFAITSVNARIAQDANINFAQDLIIRQEFSFLGDSVWFPTHEELFVEFALAKGTTGFFGKKTSHYQNVSLDCPPEGFFSGATSLESVLLEGATQRPDSFWMDSRPLGLSREEEKIYQMVDSVQATDYYQNAERLATLLGYGYWVQGNVEIGPYFYAYSFNDLEGHRFRLGLRSSNDFSKRLMLDSYLAYGTWDKRFKHNVGAMYVFSKQPRVTASLYWKHDMELLGQADNALAVDNLFGTAFRRGPLYNLLMVDQYTATFEREWFAGFMNTLAVTHRSLAPTDSVRLTAPDGTALARLNYWQATLSTRLSYDEKFVYGQFFRTSLGTRYPVLQLEATVGQLLDLGDGAPFYKAKAQLRDNIRLGTLGTFSYTLAAGKTWGTLPFPILHIHEGNETFGFFKNGFNLMNYYEFASDRFASAHMEHHFEGFFLNRLPLLRKLELREVVHAKALVGDLRPEHQALLDFPDQMSAWRAGTPYLEAGFGVENILKFLRVDWVYRLSYRDTPGFVPFGIRVSTGFAF